MKTHSLGYRILSLFAFLLASNCVEAQVTLAYCRIDGGCKFYQTALTYKEVDAMMNYMGVFEEKRDSCFFQK
ncbi:MAG: hypothetical protein R2822_05035 [Spirosomataceae bacterium]